MGHTSLVADRAAPRLLDGLEVIVDGRAGLPIRTCAEHLAWLGARRDPVPPAGGTRTLVDGRAGKLTLRPAAGGDGRPLRDEGIECTVHGWGTNQKAVGPLAHEVLIQAASGLMAIHGRDRGYPRRLGLEIASMAAGTVAAQGILAALIARHRGFHINSVETGVLQGALLFLYHHLAIATCDDPFSFPDPGAAPGPPFRTEDGHWVELEMLTFNVWMTFWKQLGVEDKALLTESWSVFVYRYLAGRCGLPSDLHEATRRYTLEELGGIAGACGVAICRVRTYPEVLAERDAGLPWWEQAPWRLSPGGNEAMTKRNRQSPADAPLSGLRVVEITSRLQGPLAGFLLQQLGAEVIKVEPPGGDFGRDAPPLAGSFGAAYLAYNRGKRVVELNYKQPQGRAAITDLVAGADAFLHNWPAGRAARLGFDFEDIARINPGLVYAHASGWGWTDDEPSPIAGDFLVQAYAGCGAGLSPPDEPPFPSRLTMLDVIGGLLACEGILAGLYLRERTGYSCRVDTSLFAGAMTLQGHMLRAAAAGQESGRRLGRPLWGPLDQPIETADGFLVLAASDARTRKRLAAICDLRSSATEDDLIERLRNRPAIEWEQRLLQADILATRVCCDIVRLPQDPRLEGLLERVNGACWAPAAPWQFKT